ncbi:MAG TPA: hypothetical protein PK874_10420 [Desulfobacteraceae bacterium]|nr:hypothetical protein [Desulfobacteraceae bacterium]HPJ68628.1 hypothetical protein [Desulfobacteraceae bacterium]HPQ27535.1 hypothetical protein [Desulfobacteraceae bacterium]
MKLLWFLLTAFIMSIFASPAYAYIGPGLGAGTIAVIFGFIISIFLAVFAVFWYPVKRILIKLGLMKKSNKK